MGSTLKSLLLTLMIAVSLAAAPGAWAEWGTSGRVIDGDTVELVSGERVRYIGIDTPELGSPGRRGTLALRAKELNQGLVLGRKVWLESDVKERDRYGRLLRYVFLVPADGGPKLFVNAELLRLGLARSSPLAPDLRYIHLFRRLEREAREQGRGIWRLEEPKAQGRLRSSLPILGNKRTRIYHRPGGRFYEKMRRSPHRVAFKNEAEAEAAGYRPSRW